jgi:molybdopterin synthase catalytic subunit
MATARVQHRDFDPGQEIAALASLGGDIGAIGCFIGTVRRSVGGKAITAMTLEHYPDMTEHAMRRIAEAAEQRWSLLGCTVIHRVGRLPPGANIVLVAAASPHRQAALDATAFLIDWLKTRAPFWKKEEFTDGSSAWVEARESDDNAAASWNQGA